MDLKVIFDNLIALVPLLQESVGGESWHKDRQIPNVSHFIQRKFPLISHNTQ